MMPRCLTIFVEQVNTHVLDYNALEEVTGTGERYDIADKVEIRLSERFYNR
jgi:hypothetical protein